MSVETLQYIELAAYIVAALFLIAAIVLFFVLKIPAVVGDLTGSTARKAIESIRQQNENAANADKNKKPTVSPTYSEMNKTSATSRMKKKSGAAPGATMKRATNELTNQAMAAAEAANATSVLTADQLPGGDSGATTVLTPEQLGVREATPVSTPQVSFTIDVEMGFAESTETIE